MTLRTKPSTKAEGKVAQLALSDFEEGQKVVAVVKKVEDYGLFLRIEGSNVSGLCHKSEVSLYSCPDKVAQEGWTVLMCRLRITRKRM